MVFALANGQISQWKGLFLCTTRTKLCNKVNLACEGCPKRQCQRLGKSEVVEFKMKVELEEQLWDQSVVEDKGHSSLYPDQSCSSEQCPYETQGFKKNKTTKKGFC